MNAHTYAKVNQQPATTGWTAPTLIYEKMRQINVSASALNSDIVSNAKRELFKNAWAGWYVSWTGFFTKYQGTAARLGAVTYTDELFQQTLSYEAQLVAWYDAYGREKDGVNPLPPPSGSPPIPNVPIPPSKGTLPEPPDDSGLKIPWWGWVFGGLAVAGAGYGLYLYVQKARAIRRVLDERVVPSVLQAYGGPAGGQLASGYGQLAAARDPFTGQVIMTPAGPPLAMPPPYSRYPGM